MKTYKQGWIEGFMYSNNEMNGESFDYAEEPDNVLREEVEDFYDNNIDCG